MKHEDLFSPTRLFVAHFLHLLKNITTSTSTKSLMMARPRNKLSIGDQVYARYKTGEKVPDIAENEKLKPSLVESNIRRFAHQDQAVTKVRRCQPKLTERDKAKIDQLRKKFPSIPPQKIVEQARLDVSKGTVRKCILGLDAYRVKDNTNGNMNKHSKGTT